MNTLLDDVKAAQVLGLKPQTLRNWRSARKGPPYVKLGRAVRYRPEDLLAYMESRKILVER